MKLTSLFAAIVSAVAGAASAQPPAPQISALIKQRTTGLERQNGYMPFYLDAAHGRVLIEVPKLHEDMLYFVQIAKGIGNVDLGVDRGAGSRRYQSSSISTRGFPIRSVPPCATAFCGGTRRSRRPDFATRSW